MGNTTYTAEMAEQIIEWISAGKPLRVFCREVEGAPKWRTVYDWLRVHEDFATAYAEARRLGFDAIAEEALEIADTPVTGTIEFMEGDKVVSVRKEEMLGHRKLQIETRLKLLAKWDPKRYGERIALAGDETSPLVVNIVDPTRRKNED